MSSTATPAPPVTPPSPAAVWDVIHGLTRYWSAAAAVRLGVFGLLAGGPLDAEALAERTGASVAHLRTLLDGVAAAGLLDKRGSRYALTPESAAFLVPGTARDMSALLLRSPGVMENWPVLAETVRSGRPAHPVEDDAESFYAALVDATFPTQQAVARRTATMLTLPAAGEPVVLELGAGAGGWTAALLEAMPGASAVVNDLPGVLLLARRRLDEMGLLGRCTMLPGDYLEVDLPAADVVVLAHVCRAEGETRGAELLRRVAAVLRPGGALLLADYLVDDGGVTPVAAALLGVTMMANTRHGTALRGSLCRAWLEQAGLTDVTLLEPLPGNPVLVGHRPEHAPGVGSAPAGE